MGADLEYVFFERHESKNWSIHLFPDWVRANFTAVAVSESKISSCAEECLERSTGSPATCTWFLQMPTHSRFRSDSRKRLTLSEFTHLI